MGEKKGAGGEGWSKVPTKEQQQQKTKAVSLPLLITAVLWTQVAIVATVTTQQQPINVGPIPTLGNMSLVKAPSVSGLPIVSAGHLVVDQQWSLLADGGAALPLEPFSKEVQEEVEEGTRATSRRSRSAAQNGAEVRAGSLSLWKKEQEAAAVARALGGATSSSTAVLVVPPSPEVVNKDDTSKHTSPLGLLPNKGVSVVPSQSRGSSSRRVSGKRAVIPWRLPGTGSLGGLLGCLLIFIGILSLHFIVTGFYFLLFPAKCHGHFGGAVGTLRFPGRSLTFAGLLWQGIALETASILFEVDGHVPPGEKFAAVLIFLMFLSFPIGLFVYAKKLPKDCANFVLIPGRESSFLMRQFAPQGFWIVPDHKHQRFKSAYSPYIDTKFSYFHMILAARSIVLAVLVIILGETLHCIASTILLCLTFFLTWLPMVVVRPVVNPIAMWGMTFMTFVTITVIILSQVDGAASATGWLVTVSSIVSLTLVLPIFLSNRYRARCKIKWREEQAAASSGTGGTPLLVPPTAITGEGNTQPPLIFSSTRDDARKKSSRRHDKHHHHHQQQPSSKKHGPGDFDDEDLFAENEEYNGDYYSPPPPVGNDDEFETRGGTSSRHQKRRSSPHRCHDDQYDDDYHESGNRRHRRNEYESHPRRNDRHYESPPRRSDRPRRYEEEDASSRGRRKKNEDYDNH